MVTSAAVHAGATDFFDNSEPAGCPITSCAIKAGGCGSAYSPGQLTLSASTPFTVTANRNVIAGYSETVCIECKNDNYGEIFQSISAPYTVSQAPACQLSMSVGSALPANPTLQYDSASPSTLVLPDSKVIYTEQWPAACTSHTCSMLASGCGGAYSGSKLIMGPANAFSITAIRNVIAGYTETVCISCTNGMDVQTHEYTVT